MLKHCFISRSSLSALGWLVLLLNLIDCQEVIKYVTNSTGVGSLLAPSQLQWASIEPSLLNYIQYKSKIGEQRQDRHKSPSRIILLTKRSIPATNANNDDDYHHPTATSLVEPIEITERVTNSTYDSLRLLAQTKAGRLIKEAHSRPMGNNGDDNVNASRSSSIGNLFSRIKSFLVTLTAKIGQSATKILKAEGNNNLHSHEAPLSDMPIIDRQPKRPSKHEIIEKILSDINIDNILSASKRSSKASSESAESSSDGANNGGRLAKLVASDANDDGGGDDAREERFTADKQPRELINTESDSSLIRATANEPGSRDGNQWQTIESGKRDRAAAWKSSEGAAPESRGATIGGASDERQANKPGNNSNTNSAPTMESTLESFRENLSIILEDQMEDWNTTSIDLDHLIKLRQQQASKSFQPIDQLEKVMGFMHFG